MTSLLPATAVAHPNIALVKYWGKRDEHLMLPCADSVSMTLDVYPTTTTVQLRPDATSDVVIMDGRFLRGESSQRVTRFLDLVRTQADSRDRVLVDSRNTAPVGAGLASSAAGFAALALAASKAFQLSLDHRALSRLARRGSGSAARSVFGGFVHWHAGSDHAPDPDFASYAEPVTDTRLDLALLAVLLDTAPKPVSSREAMRRTMTTSPAFHRWLAATRTDTALMRDALRAGDVQAVGEIAERNAMGMHAAMEAAVPPVVYRTSASHHVLRQVRRLRAAGERMWATMDAGPNVKVLCLPGDAARLADQLRRLSHRPVLVARSGPGATLHRGEVR
ncbi:diphosphomevalonate decarboxylase [Streptomyces niger]|uniref:diphosphomevalonate decarboxylase n=1 Tax=Streptomyces niger TaxID=66373 RepID=UPI00069B112D|nr:diphosphomevalonate decarboxylase [Streptomyces niger]